MNTQPTAAVWDIDQRCTNCDVARQLAPDLISEVDGRSVVTRQPRTDAEEATMLTAAFACPTRSIRPISRDLDATLDPFPLPLDEGLYFCGHNSRQTAGANSYLLERPSGNLMIDTPRTAADTPTASARGCGFTRATWTPRPMPTWSFEASSRSRSLRA